jgi:thioredoxin reductase
MSDTLNTPQATARFDVVVVGGGAAGLSAALILGRSRRSVLVVDAGEPRNAPAAHMQGVLSRDGMPPAEYLAVGRDEVQDYGVRLVGDEVTAVVPDGDGEFTVRLGKGADVHARRVVVATGLVDELPDIPGLRERWGRDVLHCPYCHGWEVRDQAFGVLAHPALGAHQALLLTQWSKNITLFLHDVAELPDGQREQLDAAGIRVVTTPIEETLTTNDKLTGVRLQDGTVVALDVLFAAGTPVPRDTLLRDLGARTTPTPVGPYTEVDPTGRTSVPGVWAVGNAAGPTEQVVNAMSAGYRAGQTINAELTFLDFGRPAKDA